MNKIKRVSETLKNEIREVVGCTEPAAIAYAFSAIAEHYRGSLEKDGGRIRAELYLSRDVHRNAEPYIIPHLREQGIRPAAAFGLFSRKHELNLFSEAGREQEILSKKLLKRKNWIRIFPLNREGIFIEARLKAGRDTYRSVIRGRHDQLRSVHLNGKPLYKGNFLPEYRIRSLEEAARIAGQRDGALERVADRVLFFYYKLHEKIGNLLEPDIVYDLIRRRMSGENIRIMTITGSGNHGIFLSMPFSHLYGKDKKRVIPAYLFSLLALLYFTQKKGRTGHACGLAAKAAPALAAGLLYYHHRSVSEMHPVIRKFEESVKGLLCEGARESCAGKGYMCLTGLRKLLKGYGL